MLFSVNDTLGYRVHALDGEIGSVHDLFFEDKTSRVRYLVADAGGWLVGRRVLLAPDALGNMDPAKHEITTHLTKEQVKNSPSVDTDKPVSRQPELELHRYYTWSPYWQQAGVYGPAPYWGGFPVAEPTRRVEETPVEREAADAERARRDPHLRSAREVIGYYIEARNGDIGHVEDLLVDEHDWAIRYIVVDTRNWLPGRKVLIATDWLERVEWASQQIVVDLTRDQIENSPEYDPSQTLDRSYQEHLYGHYGRPPYWI
jgi:uncharacterized protein YrrD